MRRLETFFAAALADGAGGFWFIVVVFCYYNLIILEETIGFHYSKFKSNEKSQECQIFISFSGLHLTRAV